MGILQGAGRRNLLVFYDVFYNAEKLLKEFGKLRNIDESGVIYNKG